MFRGWKGLEYWSNWKLDKLESAISLLDFSDSILAFSDWILEFSDSILEFSDLLLELLDSILEFSDSILEFSLLDIRVLRLDSRVLRHRYTSFQIRYLDTWTKVDLADIIGIFDLVCYNIQYMYPINEIPLSVLLCLKINYFYTGNWTIKIMRKKYFFQPIRGGRSPPSPPLWIRHWC